MARKHTLILGFIGLFAAVIFLAYKSPLGAGIIKSHIFSKVPFFNRFEVKNFSYSFNNFSMELKKGNNTISVFGSLFPFNSVYEAKLLELGLITNEFRGSVLSSGNIKDNDLLNISGNAIMADGFGEFSVDITNSIDGHFKGNGFNLKEILRMIKVDFPYLDGNVDLNIKFINSIAQVIFDVKDAKFNFKNLNTPIGLNGKAIIMDRENFNLHTNFKSNVGEGDFSVSKKGGFLTLKGDVKDLKLLVLKNLTLYPFKSKADIKFDYSQTDGLLNFNSKTFEGYYHKKLYIQLKNQPTEEFFKYVDIKPLISGIVTGSITINKEGEFDILFNNSKFLKNRYIRYIERTAQINLSKPQTIFIKGHFNKRYVKFNLLSKADKFSLGIDKGIYYYNKKFKFNLYVVKRGKFYKYRVTNKSIRLIKIKYLGTSSSETLVY